MNRTQYLQARRLLRGNGAYALRWMDAATRASMERLLSLQRSIDWLGYRQSMVSEPDIKIRTTTWIILS